ncbi:dienelactone hydrolase family protein [Streptomyces sp. NPDC005989]|uniref:dienelactone hydrolase family protein n=1 Tax=unclassified Streptomyces TaxID=2593676 RepID=UPI003400F3BF
MDPPPGECARHHFGSCLGRGGHGTRVALFYAGRDHVIDAAQVEAVRTALTEAGVRHDVSVHEDAPHAFFFPGHDTYDKVAADTSWERVAALFRTELQHGNG